MNNEQRMVREFHKSFGHDYRDQPDANVELGVQSLRLDLIQEELEELNDAMLDRNIVEVADALADLLYVVYGTAVVYGINMEPIVQEVHRSNMSKIALDGSVEYDERGKVMKPETFEEPQLRGLLRQQGASL